MKDIRLAVGLIMFVACDILAALLTLHIFAKKETVIKSKEKVNPSMEMTYIPTVDSFMVDTFYIYRFK